MKKNMYRHKCTKLLLHVVGINKMIFFLSLISYLSIEWLKVNNTPLPTKKKERIMKVVFSFSGSKLIRGILKRGMK